MSIKLIGLALLLCMALWTSISVQHSAGRMAPARGSDAPGAGFGDFPVSAAGSRLSAMPGRDSACLSGRRVAAAVMRPAGWQVCT